MTIYELGKIKITHAHILNNIILLYCSVTNCHSNNTANIMDHYTYTPTEWIYNNIYTYYVYCIYYMQHVHIILYKLMITNR